MILEPVWEWLEAQVFCLPSVGGEQPLFNFYRDEHPEYDRPGAAAARRSNLRGWLERFEAMPELLVVGEAPGWRGCRFTGIPFTSEALFAAGELPYTARLTRCIGTAPGEATATVFWQAFQAAERTFFTWNCLPLHPHTPGRPESNRTPLAAERRAFQAGLVALAAMLQPRQVLAIGRCAQVSLQEAGIAALPIRHPSHGGAPRFLQDVAAALLN